MRTKIVTINGKKITIKEQKIKQLRDETLPKAAPVLATIKGADVSNVVDVFGEQLKEFFPELKDVDFDDCYPSEIEEFLEGFIDVNFTGLKRLLGPLFAFVKMAQQKQGLDLVSPLDNLTTGKN